MIIALYCGEFVGQLNFKAKIYNTPNIVDMRQSTSVECLLAFNSNNSKTKNNSRFLAWKPPPEGFFKLNTDGSALGNPGRAGAGGLIRDHQGNWVGGFSRKIGQTSSVAAELWGCETVSNLLCNWESKNSHISIDAQSIIAFIHATPDDVEYHQYSCLISDCKWLLQQLEDHQIQHSHRETNQCADSLAKRPLSFIEVHHFVFCFSYKLTFKGSVIPVSFVIDFF